MVVGTMLGATSTTLAVSAVAVVSGHIFPVFLGFRGGKGVATAAGVGLCLAPSVTFVAVAVFAVVVAITRFVSVGSIVAAISLPTLAHFGASFDAEASVGFESQLALAIIAAMVVVKHRGNLRRLLDGNESKLAQTRHRAWRLADCGLQNASLPRNLS